MKMFKGKNVLNANQAIPTFPNATIVVAIQRVQLAKIVMMKALALAKRMFVVPNVTNVATDMTISQNVTNVLSSGGAMILQHRMVAKNVHVIRTTH